MANYSKIVIQKPGMEIKLDDSDLKFSMVGQEYSDDDMSTEPYSLRELINNAEVYREKADLTIQTNWEKYQRELKQLKAENMRLMDENKLLKDKLISQVLEVSK